MSFEDLPRTQAIESAEREYTPEEIETLERFRAEQTAVLDAAIEESDPDFTIMEYMNLPESFKQELLQKFPDLENIDEQTQLFEYERYAMWHMLVGSTPNETAHHFDFPEGSSVAEFMSDQYKAHVEQNKVDNS